MNWPKAALIFVLLLCVSKTLRYRHLPTLDDFSVYQAAAALVRTGQSSLLYQGADTGHDPQLALADPHSAIAKSAKQLGISTVRLYVYPPMLADMMTPLSVLDFTRAGRLWTAINVLCCLAVFGLLAALLQIRLFSAAGLALLVGLWTFNPLLDCIRWGQITILLLLLWTFGIYAYVRGWVAVSAFVLALATAIKLTPLLAVLPFVVWRRWRWIGAYLLSCLALLATLLAVNGPACLAIFVRRVMPAMSDSNAFLSNRSLLSVSQLMYLSLKGGNVYQPNLPPSHQVATIGKALGLLCILAAGLLMLRNRRLVSTADALATMAVLPLLSVLLSPVSWEHAYAICFLTFAVLWTEVFRKTVPVPYLLLLTFSSFELNWFTVSYVLRRQTMGVPFGLLSLIPILCGLALVFYRLILAPRLEESASAVYGRTSPPLPA